MALRKSGIAPKIFPTLTEIKDTIKAPPTLSKRIQLQPGKSIDEARQKEKMKRKKETA